MKSSFQRIRIGFIGTIIILLTFLLVTSCTKEIEQKAKFGLVIHGGAGSIERGKISPEIEKEYEAKLTEALETGYKILSDGGTSLDAVETVINILEDSPLFNAGKGAVFTHNGLNELDASIMDGSTLNAGAVARLTRIKNPITLARGVMEKSEHVMMVGDGAEQFGVENGFELVDPLYFYTEKSWEALQRALKKEEELKSKDQAALLDIAPGDKHGTVGAAALDMHGNLAAGTSTGGMSNKKYGRAGDVPVIGAGTYAKNVTCAVSCTGHGEYFIRLGVAKDISDMMEYKMISLDEAANEVIHQKLEELGGTGGLIGIDKYGNITMPFNTSGMFRGYILEKGKANVSMYKD